MTPRTVYLLAVSTIIAIVILTGAWDFGLWLRGDVTISAWLRCRPAMFVLPMSAALIFLAALALHLFLDW
jgi:hypothetical protein